ncbi:MAG: transaldolase, partial [Bdellovibrionales bacterium]|nr:transaldolase [Bdellovibrionales bacterium]
TSNPSIFKNAIADSSDYDTELSQLYTTGATTEDICETLMLSDVAAAADLLRPIYEESNGADGFASIEVSPFLASNTQATIEAGRKLWGSLDRPNIMIKVPATVEGIPAIKQLLIDGINVNITLIFSLEVYKTVVKAYIEALEERANQGKSLDNVASVASFFVSRVEAIVEKSFQRLLNSSEVDKSSEDIFLGKIGIANSKLAYEFFESSFNTDRFKSLAAKGANVQRPLWASTGTKNPSFSPVLYVEELAGRDTVNTLPPATLKKLMEKAQIEPKLHSGLAEAKEVISKTKALGIPFDELLLELQTAGVKAFADAYQELLNALESKSKAVA